MTLTGILLEDLWPVQLFSCLEVKVFTEKAVVAIPLLPIKKLINIQ